MMDKEESVRSPFVVSAQITVVDTENERMEPPQLVGHTKPGGIAYLTPRARGVE